MTIRRALGALIRSGSDSEQVADLRVEVGRLREQNEKMRAAMRRCVDCEYRVEIMTQRAGMSASADGSRLGLEDRRDQPGS